MAAKIKRGEVESGQVDPRFVPVVDAFAGDPMVSRKRMFASSSVLTVNGKIFVMLARDQFVAKLPKSRVDQLIQDGLGEYFDPGHGRLMKEWVAVNGRQHEWIDLAREAYRFVKESTRPFKAADRTAR